MTKIAEYFIRKPRVASLVLFLIVFMGIITFTGLRRQGDPTIDFDIMTITTEYPGASPEDVEVNVTDPIEDQLKDVEDIDELMSVSMENVSVITVIINPDSLDVERVKDDVKDAVERVTDLPSQVTDKPKVSEIRSTNLPVMEIAILGSAPEIELRQYAKDLENELKEVSGIGVIQKIGYRKKELHINADQELLNQKYISLNEIMNAIKARNVRITGGSLESYVSEKKIVTFSEYDDPMEVKDVIIRSTFIGKRIVVSDVAEVKAGFEDHDLIPRANGKNCISLSIRSQANADVITISESVKKILVRFRNGLPDNIKAEIMFDNSDYTKSLLSMVKTNGLIGFVLVLIAMLLFLDKRSAFWTAFGIPISICGAFILFPLFGITINIISLSAMILVLGMLVDDAIVISENVYRMKQEGMEPVEATIAGVKNVFWPVCASILTTILAFMPMLFMSGIIGKFVFSIPIVVMLMLGFSLIESTCFLPCHIAHAKPPKKKPKYQIMEKLARMYKERLRWCLKNRKKLLSLYVVAFVLVLSASSIWLKFIIFPVNDPDMFHIIIETSRGTSLTNTAEKAYHVEEIVSKTIPKSAIRSFVTRVGNRETDLYAAASGGQDNHALVTTYLWPAEKRNIKAENIVNDVEKAIGGMEGYDKLYVQVPESGPPVGNPVNIVYVSDDDNLRNKFEKETYEYLKTIYGVYGVKTDNVQGKDELRLKLDYDKMAKIGITAIDVSTTVRAAFDGEIVTSIRKGGEEIDFRVRLKEPKKYRAEGVLDLKVANNTGSLVPLSSFGRFEEARGVAAMHHYDGRRSVTVSSQVDTEIITATEVNDLVDEKFGPLARKHAGFKMQLMGEQDKTKESLNSFYAALSVALVAIFFLLVVLFNSYTQPLLIMSAIPFGVLGVFIAFMIHGLPLGFIALVGILGLTGVVINTSIVMISTINEQCEKMGCKCFEAIIEAARIRFRPVILTTVTTVCGLLPTAYGIGGDLPFVRPMVLAMAWGLVFATIISLVFIPLIYALHARVVE